MKRSASRARGPALGGAVLRCSVTSSREATRGERPRGSRGLARWQRGRLAQLHRKVRPWFWSTYVRATLRPPCRQGAPGCTSRHSGCQEKASALRRFASASGTESVLGMRVPVITTRSEGHLPSAFLRDQPTPSLLSGGSGCPVGQHSKPVTGPDGGPCGFQGSRPRPAREQLGLLPPMATKPSSVPLHPRGYPCGLRGFLHVTWQPGGVGAVFGEEGPRLISVTLSAKDTGMLGLEGLFLTLQKDRELPTGAGGEA